MSYSYYTQHCVNYMQEIDDMLSYEEKERIMEMLNIDDGVSLVKWKLENLEDIKKFTIATPEVRKKNKKWNSTRDHFIKLSFFAYEKIMYAKFMFERIESIYLGSYRATIYDAAETLERTCECFDDIPTLETFLGLNQNRE